jgi:hypothetical protein
VQEKEKDFYFREINLLVHVRYEPFLDNVFFTFYKNCNRTEGIEFMLVNNSINRNFELFRN